MKANSINNNYIEQSVEQVKESRGILLNSCFLIKLLVRLLVIGVE